MDKDTIKYEEWLTTIAHTRLIYNTMEELEQMLDNHSIHSNGIRRSFPTLQKMRAAFRDLKEEVKLMAGNDVELDCVLSFYQSAWQFYRQHLYRRTNPEQIAFELLSYCYSSDKRGSVRTKKQAIYEQVEDEEIHVPCLILLLMKALPGYDSKEGDVTEMPRQYERVMQLMERFVANNPTFNLTPPVIRAREEENKCRLMLLAHVSRILNVYESYDNPINLYEASNDFKSQRVHLDIRGFWNECDGQLLYTSFWQIEDDMDESGTYFATHWHKDGENRLTGIRYTMVVVAEGEDKLVYYMIHPEAIKQRMMGQKYRDVDQAWYLTKRLEDTPDELPLERLIGSGVWPQKIGLSRCTDDKVLEQYDQWFHTCEIVKPYQHLEYVFTPNLYAITQTHLYISSKREGEFYKVPKEAHKGFEMIHLYDAVGLMEMDGKTYLAFDDFMLYISTSPKQLKKYGIERVQKIV